jgi:hypothetical protein
MQNARKMGGFDVRGRWDWIRWGGMEAYVSKASAGEVDLKRPKYQKVCTQKISAPPMITD